MQIATETARASGIPMTPSLTRQGIPDLRSLPSQPREPDSPGFVVLKAREVHKALMAEPVEGINQLAMEAIAAMKKARRKVEKARKKHTLAQWVRECKEASRQWMAKHRRNKELHHHAWQRNAKPRRQERTKVHTRR